MAYCSRCWLNQAMRIANLLVSFLGVGVIIYSLCLLKIWREGIAEVTSAPSSALPGPRFIYTFLAAGIIVCFSAVLGHSVSNRINIATLSTYILFIITILVIQIEAIMVNLFRIDWQSIVSKYLDGADTKFEGTLSFHLHLCRLVGVVIIIAQVNVLILAIVLCILRPQPISHCLNGPTAPSALYSFLVAGSDSPPALPASIRSFVTRCQV